MNKCLIGLVLAVAAGGFSARAATTPPNSDSDTVLHYLLPETIGTRITQAWLLDKSHGRDNSFLGSIDYLRERNYPWPDKIYADWALCRYAYFEATWDWLKADASGNGGADPADGEINMSGPIFTVVARYPNDTKFTPFAGAGIAVFQGHFDHAPWHQLGYHSEEDWVAAGMPQPSADNPGSRHIYNNDGNGFVVTAGFDYAITPNWIVNLYGRYMNIDTHYTYQLVNSNTGEITRDQRGTFPMSNIALGLGVGYKF